MKIQIIRHGVTDGGGVIPVGTEIELDEKNARSLVADGYAAAVEAEDDPLTPEAMAKALDKAYKADDLKAAATAAGVEFAEGAVKADVIAAVIAAGKYDDLMTH